MFPWYIYRTFMAWLQGPGIMNNKRNIIINLFFT